MNFKKIILVLLCLTIICISFSGCSSNEDYVLYFELDEEPNTLDPQLADSMSETLLVRNLFEGLTRLDQMGSVVNGVAETITQSGDGLVYTFKIKDSAVWSNGDNVTAEDFVLAFERAVSPDTRSSRASMLYCIENAEEINTGKTKGGLGVTALDSKTLKIKLDEKNPDFFEILASSICMPCHISTFNKAKGKYGLNDEDIVTNGSFKLRSWEKGENFSLRIDKIDVYTGDFTSQASAVIFNKGDINGRAARIEEANVDLGFINLTEATEDNSYYAFERTCYALVINKNSDLGNANFRQAFEKSIHRNRLSNELSQDLTVANNLLPNVISIEGSPLSSQIKVDPLADYNPTNAHELYLKGVKETKAPSTATIIYYGNDSVTDMASIIAEGFQQSLGAVVNIKNTASETELFSTLSVGEYQLAIVPITAKDNSAEQFLNMFVSGNSNNVYGYSNTKYNQYVGKLSPTSHNAEIKTVIKDALNTLASDHSVIPLAQYSEAFGYSKVYTCPNISPFNGVIDLSLVRLAK